MEMGMRAQECPVRWRHGEKTLRSKNRTSIADEAPSSANLTTYDVVHLVLYLQLLDACADGAAEEELAREILGIDPTKEPWRAQRAVESHLRRARWMRETGYRYLANELT
jgi:hypothetical protein